MGPMKAYVPSPEILKRYADVLVKFALGGGSGIRKGDVLYATVPECAKPLLFHLQRAILEAGGHLILNYRPNDDPEYNFSAAFYAYAAEHHLDYFPRRYFKGLIEEADHTLFIQGETDPFALSKIQPDKILRRGKAMKPFGDWRRDKEHRGKLTWTIGLYGTEAMAKTAGMSLREYWKQIEDACFLAEKNPIAKWKGVYRDIHSYQKKLNALSPKTARLHVESSDADLWITLGEKRIWLAGSGRNIPSFEIFTSPDWRGTEGWIRFNQPLYRYGSRVTGIELEFKKGRVVKASAKTGEKLLQSMIRTPNADKVGEFSLTDRRHSRITKFMANTLFDENMGGPQGNTHIAVGSAYLDTYRGNPASVTPALRKKLGYNDSSVHTDMISTAKRRVTAHFKNGSRKVIYDNGQFTL